MTSTNTIQYGNTPQCKICRLQTLDTDINFYSNLAIKQYTVDGHGACNAINCIYLISCKAKNFHIKSVGVTTTKLNKRLAGHRANMLNWSEGEIL